MVLLSRKCSYGSYLGSSFLERTAWRAALHRSVDGSRQSARYWHRRLDEAFVKNGFKAIVADPCLYVKNTGNVLLFVIVCIKDLLVAFSNESKLAKVYKQLRAEFELTVLRDLRQFVGVAVKREGNAFKLGQRYYIDKLLEVFGIEDCEQQQRKLVNRTKILPTTNWTALFGCRRQTGHCNKCGYSREKIQYPPVPQPLDSSKARLTIILGALLLLRTILLFPTPTSMAGPKLSNCSRYGRYKT